MNKSAELPINARGAVYHLDLCPEEIGDLVITVGDPGRVSRVSQHFDRIEFQRTHREFITHTGYIGQKRITVLSTGIGMPNIDIVMNELDALVNVDLKTGVPHAQLKSLDIIRLGTTGGLLQETAPGDIYFSRYAIGFDTLLDYYHRELSDNLVRLKHSLDVTLAGEASSFFVTAASESLQNQFKSAGTEGITATCGGFYGPQGRVIRKALRYPDLLTRLADFDFDGYKVTNLEMETAALLGLAELLGHRCISVSVALANRRKGLFVSNVEEQVDKLIAKILGQI